MANRNRKDFCDGLAIPAIGAVSHAVVNCDDDGVVATVQALALHQLQQGPGKLSNLRVLVAKYGPAILEDTALLREGMQDFLVTTRAPVVYYWVDAFCDVLHPAEGETQIGMMERKRGVASTAQRVLVMPEPKWRVQPATPREAAQKQRAGPRMLAQLWPLFSLWSAANGNGPGPPAAAARP
jgi:hypothetical protein